jgi:signal transduction histidine kinase
MINTKELNIPSYTIPILGMILFLQILSGCKSPNALPFQYQEGLEGEKTPFIAKLKFTNSSKSGIFNPGYTTSYWWIKTEISNQSNIPEIKFIRLNNPHINVVDVFYRYSGKHIRMGDQFPFQMRNIQHSDFIIPVKIRPHSTEEIFMGIDKKGEALSLQTELLNEKEVQNLIKNELLFSGILIGWMVLLILVIIITWIQNREKANIYYILYIVSITLWILANWGTAFQLFWPNAPEFQNIARPLLILLANMFFLNTILIHFSDKKSFSRIRKLILGCLYLTLILFTVVLSVNIKEIYSGFKIHLLNIMSITLLTSVFLVVLYIYLNWRKGGQNTVLYLFGISFFILMFLFQLIYPFGMNSTILDFLSLNGASISLVGEMSIIAVVFINNINKVKVRNESLEKQLLQYEMNNSNEINTIQEIERNRIGKDLHDTIGGLLGTLNMHVNKSELKYPDIDWDIYRNIITDCIHETKVIVDNLVPTQVEQLGFCIAFESYLVKIKKSSKTEIIFYHEVNSEINISKQTIIFRILIELLNNANKHANASEINITITEDNKTIVILFEDNGIGYNLNEINSGHGLKIIANRVQYVNGKIQTFSNKNGTSNIIYIPAFETIN